MPKLPYRVPYVRLRQRDGDRVLHITANGHTTSGHLYGVTCSMTSGEAPRIHLELQTGELGPYGEEPGSTDVQINMDSILACDVAALDYDRLGPPGQLLKRDLHDMAQYLIPGPEPTCLHEDVIDVTAIDDAQPQGMCGWCGGKMVAELHTEVRQGPWHPAAS